MSGLLSNFSLAIWVSSFVAGLAGLLTVVTLLRRRGPTRVIEVARIWAFGFAAIALVATSIRGRRLTFELGGDLVLMPGGAGLGDLPQVADAPTSLAAVLLVGNVVLYIPVAAAAVVGWYSHRRLVLLICLLLSLAVETTQYLALGRVAAVDDVILNMIGAAIGYVMGTWAVRRRGESTVQPNEGDSGDRVSA